METTREIAMPITAQELLNHWQGHRKLTRKVIEAFPEKELFDYSVEGMRPFAKLVKELLAIAVPGLRQIVEGTPEQLNEDITEANSKANILTHHRGQAYVYLRLLGIQPPFFWDR